jgi:hypothetical protein
MLTPNERKLMQSLRDQIMQWDSVEVQQRQAHAQLVGDESEGAIRTRAMIADQNRALLMTLSAANELLSNLTAKA